MQEKENVQLFDMLYSPKANYISCYILIGGYIIYQVFSYYNQYVITTKKHKIVEYISEIYKDDAETLTLYLLYLYEHYKNEDKIRQIKYFDFTDKKACMEFVKHGVQTIRSSSNHMMDCIKNINDLNMKKIVDGDDKIVNKIFPPGIEIWKSFPLFVKENIVEFYDVIKNNLALLLLFEGFLESFSLKQGACDSAEEEKIEKFILNIIAKIKLYPELSYSIATLSVSSEVINISKLWWKNKITGTEAAEKSTKCSLNTMAISVKMVTKVMSAPFGFFGKIVGTLGSYGGEYYIKRTTTQIKENLYQKIFNIEQNIALDNAYKFFNVSNHSSDFTVAAACQNYLKNILEKTKSEGMVESFCTAQAYMAIIYVDRTKNY